MGLHCLPPSANELFQAAKKTQAMEFLPWDALGPPVCGVPVPRGQALWHRARVPAHSEVLNPL